MADSKLQPLLDAAEKATPGPWVTDRPTRISSLRLRSESGDYVCERYHGFRFDQDVVFCMEARNSIPEIQRLVSLELRLREYVDSLEKYGSDFTPMELASPGVEARMSFAAAQVKKLKDILENALC